jgi:hypothetical protein
MLDCVTSRFIFVQPQGRVFVKTLACPTGQYLYMTQVTTRIRETRSNSFKTMHAWGIGNFTYLVHSH